MLFTEPTFLFLFLPVLLTLYFAPASARILAGRASPAPTIRCKHEAPACHGRYEADTTHGRYGASTTHGRYANWLLLVASVLFYATGGGTFTWLMLGSIAFNYWMAIAVAARRSRAWLVFAVAANLAVLGIFKYANFSADNVNTLFLALSVQPLIVPRVLLPIGISFFTFHAISYVVDVFRGHATAQKSPVHAALYLLLFPQLIAGPIIRYREIADQLAQRTVTIDDFAYGVRRFVTGFAKKVLIANVVAGPADAIFGMPSAQLSPAHAWLGLICYTLQIYFDFSGYSDMAIGLGRMFGFRFPENFRWPYIAGSVQDFWRRWHISLSSWFRDYLYVPLGGNRVPPARMYRNLVTVFFLCGLWHGASWNFAIWGLWHGLFLVFERVSTHRRVQYSARTLRVGPFSRARAGARHAYTLLVVLIGWVFFRADTLAGALAFLRALAGVGPAAPTSFTLQWYLTPELTLALVAGAIGSTPWVRALAAHVDAAAGAGRPSLARNMALLSTGALIVLLVASIMQVAAKTYNPFIYFRF